MKFLLVIFIFFSTKLVGQEIIFLDSVSNNPIESVTLTSKISGVSSDFSGIANVSFFENSDTIIITHLSYHTRKFIKSNLPELILLSPKIRTLPVVTLKGATRLFNFDGYLLEKKLNQEKLSSKSTTELLQKITAITIQESQAGGGSPNFRGCEANRLLVVVDGLPLNNTIYRSGHLQNTSTINPFFIRSICLATGPSAISFGDGALGAALLFNTVSPVFLKKSSHVLHQQYESSSETVMLNYKSNYSTKKIAFISGISIRSIGNLRMGSNRFHGFKDWGKESIISKGKEQLYTNYDQADFIHKTLFKLNNKLNLLLNTQYSTSSNINRFDKLNDISNGEQKYSDWYYGPQKRFLQIVEMNSISSNLFFEKTKMIFGFQNILESRHYKKTNENLMSNRLENVNIYDVSINFKKSISTSKINYGLGSRKQIVSSSANKKSSNGEIFYNTTRYPNGGSRVIDFFIYSQANFQLSRKLKLYMGCRLNYNELTALFTDTKTYNFSFNKITNKNQSLIGSVLLNYNITSLFILNAAIYSGFRNPNLDDIGKIFSKNDTYVIVPNPNLNPEKSNTIEIGFNSTVLNRSKIQVQFFNTIISDAISREFSLLNNQDSILYDGEMMKIQTNKNIESANIYGFNFNYNYTLSDRFVITSNCNYLIGKTINNFPLAHIPPLNAKFNVNYIMRNYSFHFNIKYTNWKKTKDYDLAGVDNLEEATVEGTPPWSTINLHYTCKINNNITYRIGVDNLLDSHYKTFGSGISSSGRNFILSLSTNF